VAVGAADKLEEQLAAALADVDQELLTLFFRNRKGWDGTLAGVPADYAARILAHLPKFKAQLEQFAKEPF
jgi:hypothetical protein